MTLIDTSAWIHSLRQDGDTIVRNRVRSLLEAGEAAWCDLVRLELWNGARGRHETRVLAEMESALPLLPVNETVWGAAVATARRARATGTTVPATDILIHACAHVHNVSLEHADRHFAFLDAL